MGGPACLGLDLDLQYLGTPWVLEKKKKSPSRKDLVVINKQMKEQLYLSQDGK